MLKLKTRSNTGSDTLTRDPAKIADPVTCDPETQFHLWQKGRREKEKWGRDGRKAHQHNTLQ